MNVWMRGVLTPCSDSMAASMSSSLVRASDATTQPTALPTSRMPSTSPGDEIANPASMMSTPSRSSWRAISTFSPALSAMPGDCSPSRSVVSKIRTASVVDDMRENLLRVAEEGAPLPLSSPRVRVRRGAARVQKSLALPGEEDEEKAEEAEREQRGEPDGTPAQRGAGGDLLGSRVTRHPAHTIRGRPRAVKPHPHAAPENVSSDPAPRLDLQQLEQRERDRSPDQPDSSSAPTRLAGRSGRCSRAARWTTSINTPRTASTSIDRRRSRPVLVRYVR